MQPWRVGAPIHSPVFLSIKARMAMLRIGQWIWSVMNAMTDALGCRL